MVELRRNCSLFYLQTAVLVGVVRIYILVGMLHLALSPMKPGKVGNDVRGRADAGIRVGFQASGGFPRS